MTISEPSGRLAVPAIEAGRGTPLAAKTRTVVGFGRQAVLPTFYGGVGKTG